MRVGMNKKHGTSRLPDCIAFLTVAHICFTIASYHALTVHAQPASTTMSQVTRQESQKRTTSTEDHIKTFMTYVESIGLQDTINTFGDVKTIVATSQWGTLRPRAKQRELAQTKESNKAILRLNKTYQAQRQDAVVTVGSWRLAKDATIAGQYILVWRANERKHLRLSFALFVNDDSLIAHHGEDTGISIPSTSIAGQTGNVLTLAEIQFGGICGASGMASAFATLAIDDVAVLRTGGSFVGKQRAVNDTRIQSERWRYIPQQSGIDDAHELAYAFGRYTMTATNEPTERGYFVRIWQAMPGKDKNDSANWRVVIDAATPLSRM
jgi:hypothetical protein